MAQKSFASFDDLKRALAYLTPDDFLLSVDLTPALAQGILEGDPVNRDLRKAQVDKLKREILAGQWDIRKSPPLRFLEGGRLIDGQHRCRAVIASGQPIPVLMVVVPDTLGLDQGVGRTLADQLKIHENISDKQERELASQVTKAICRTPQANDREQVEFFTAHRAFILECVRKPLGWLADKEVSVAAVIKPSLLAVTRAQEIALHEQDPTEVDELLEDVVNGGETAPENSARRHVARQIWDLMQTAHTKKGAKLKDVVKWVSVGLEHKRKNLTRSVMLARFPGKGRAKRKPPVKAEESSPQAAMAL
jgi:hypothetical protein